MAKWARVNRFETQPVLEVIDYNPVGVINEQFLPEFVSCSDEVWKGYYYNHQTKEFFLPEGHAKHPNFDIFGYVDSGENEVDENGFIVYPTPPEPPRSVTEEEFKTQLKLQEKILWNTPEFGTTQQAATINTVKQEFPLLAESAEFLEILELLESLEIIGVDRAQEILDFFVPPTETPTEEEIV